MSDNQIKTESIDVLIIGAGPSGTVAAAILQKKGYKVHIVEKQCFPRFVIGESLLPRCMENFDKAGLIGAIEKNSFQKKFGAKFVQGDSTCDFDFSQQYTKGWSWTWQVQRSCFDKVLADEVQNRDVPLDYETEVTDVVIHEDGTSITTVRNTKGEEHQIKAKYIIDASGFGRVLPRLLDLDAPSDIPARASLFTHIDSQSSSTDPERQRIIIVVHDIDVWAWVIPFADGSTSVGVVGSAESINKFEGSLDEQMKNWINEIAALNERFSNHEFKFEPRKIIGYSSAVKQLYGKGYALTGNASGFIDPVFSSGVTLATESGARAAELIIKEFEGEDANWEDDYSNYIKDGVKVFKTFIEAWYDGTLPTIFFSPNANDKIRKQICSVLAGYVWDKTNPFVTKPQRVLSNILKIIS
ncbi:NAD(P)/FAD-dependent oxidoreductase [Fulvivirga ligni]|uniref:NAD(P)/FAD-dependent oxidoreductase n=1 Tax=Fulvivirga ligni TaxID=2904246 RepID=UPI001F203427|nr:NAD(P)/FAD-dependent oxidoreductase [Fulvivirga ligni]UII22944.1 tryptophan 7-halogenase [Fulvivirga ligni]